MYSILLKSTGKCSVYTSKFDLFDENRPEINHPKGILVPAQIYFPVADKSDAVFDKIIENRAPRNFDPIKYKTYARPVNFEYLNLQDFASRDNKVPRVTIKNQIASRETFEIFAQYNEDIAMPLVILSHANFVAMTDYAMIAEDLASHGYFVLSLQHQLYSDSEAPQFHSDRSTAKHSRIIDNILYSFKWLQENNEVIFNSKIDLTKVALIGHSMSANALFLLANRVSSPFKTEMNSLLPETKKECIVFLDGEFDYPRRSQVPILFCLSEERQNHHYAIGLIDELKSRKYQYKHYKKTRHVSFMDHSWVLHQEQGSIFFHGSEMELAAFWQDLRADIREFIKASLNDLSTGEE